MPKKMNAQLDLLKIPVIGLVVQKNAGAPASPADGQVYYDTGNNRFYGRESGTMQLLSQVGSELLANKNAVSGYAGLDGSSKIAIAQIPTGQTGTTVPLGNDARFTDTRVPTDGSVTGGTAGAGVKIAANTITAANIVNATITDVQIAAANKDGVAGTASLRTLGTGATQAAAGNDARLSDTRVPTDASVTGGAAGAGVKIAANTITIANLAASLVDQAAGTASLRTLAYTATTAMPGNARLDQIATNTPPTAAINVNGQEITNLGAPTAASSAARLADIQAAQAGIDAKPSVRAVSTAQRALTGLTAIDGVTLVDGDRVLNVANTTGSENGPWIVHSGAWTRPANETVTAGAFWLVTEGSNAGTQWKVSTPDPIVLGTTALTIVQWGAAGTVYTGTSNRITVTAGAIDISASYVGQTSITTLGTVTTGTWTGTAIAVANGGTGATAAPAARTNLGAAGKYVSAPYTTAIVAGTPFTITHNLNTQDVTVSVRNTATNEHEDFLVTANAVNTITLTSDAAYASPSFVVTVVG